MCPVPVPIMGFLSLISFLPNHSYLTYLKMCQALLRGVALSLQESGGPGGGSSSGWGGEGGQGKGRYESVMESLVMMGFARSADTGRHT